MSAIVINDIRDVHLLDAPWSTLRRSGGQVELTAAALPEGPRSELERNLNASLNNCGCDEGALGVVVFSLLAATRVLMPSRGLARRPAGPSVNSVWRAIAWIASYAMVGGAVGKGAGLAAARSRFARHRRRLRTEFESIDGSGVR